MKKENIHDNKIIDILKIFFSICVVAIHTGIFSDRTSLTQYFIFQSVFRLAVPFFFVCSGYFIGLKLFNKKDKSDKTIVIKKQISRLKYPLFFWLIIGIPIQIYFLKDNSSIYIILKLVQKSLFYPWNAFWYVLALIVALVIILQFYKKNKLELCFKIACFLYCFSLICNNYYFAIENTFIKFFVDKYMYIFISARNGLFVGLFFVTAGVLLAKKSLSCQFQKKKNIIILIVVYLLFLLEIFFIKDKKYLDDSSLFIMILPVIVEIIICSNFVKLKFDTKKLRNYSTGLYFTHSTIRDIIKILFLTLCGREITSSITLFSLTLFISFLLVTVLFKINNEKIDKIIK